MGASSPTSALGSGEHHHPEVAGLGVEVAQLGRPAAGRGDAQAALGAVDVPSGVPRASGGRTAHHGPHTARLDRVGHRGVPMSEARVGDRGDGHSRPPATRTVSTGRSGSHSSPSSSSSSQSGVQEHGSSSPQCQPSGHVE